MGGYEELIAGIKAVVRRNGRREITGDALQQVLVGMVSAIGANSAFAGVANPETDPGSPDQNVFWIAAAPGTYTHFGDIELGGPAIISNSLGRWSATELNIPSGRAVPQFMFTYAGSNHMERGTASNDNGNYNILVWSDYLDLHILGEQDGIEGYSLNMYRYEGYGRHRVPFIKTNTYHFTGEKLYFHGSDTVVSSLLDSAELLIDSGLNNHLDSEEFVGVAFDAVKDCIEGISMSPMLKFINEWNEREISFYHSDLLHDRGPSEWRTKNRKVPLATMRFGLSLTRDDGTEGPIVPYRAGIYVTRAKGESGIGSYWNDVDIYVKCGLIQQIDKAYNFNISF